MLSSSSQRSNTVENILSAVGSLLPANLSEDIKSSFLNAFRTTLENMDIVTRDEIEVQETVLQRAQEKIKDLEARIAELESRQN